MLNDYHQFINFYIDDIKGTGYLAFRDLPSLFQNVSGKKALDFGCGAGRSSNYLKKLGYHVTGIDIDRQMIKQAAIHTKSCEFLHLTGKQLPFQDHTFDLVFNSFVLFDISSKEEIISIFQELKRVCKKDGEIVSIINSEYLFTKQWLTIKNNFSQNINLKSGDIARLFLSDLGIDIYDYYWTQNDYEACFKKAGLCYINKHEPLGYPNEGYNWQDELIYPPYSIYICK